MRYVGTLSTPQFFCESKTILNKTFTRNMIGGLWALCELVPLPPPPLLPSSIESAHNNSPPTPSLPVRGALLFTFMISCVWLCSQLMPFWLPSSLDSAMSRTAPGPLTTIVAITPVHPFLASTPHLSHSPPGIPPGPSSPTFSLVSQVTKVSINSDQSLEAGVLGVPLQQTWLHGDSELCVLLLRLGISMCRSAVHLINCSKLKCSPPPKPLSLFLRLSEWHHQLPGGMRLNPVGGPGPFPPFICDTPSAPGSLEASSSMLASGALSTSVSPPCCCHFHHLPGCLLQPPHCLLDLTFFHSNHSLHSSRGGDCKLPIWPRGHLPAMLAGLKRLNLALLLSPFSPSSPPTSTLTPSPLLHNWPTHHWPTLCPWSGTPFTPLFSG